MATFTNGERSIFRRRPKITLSEWASKNLIVKDGPYAGSRYRPDVNPYLVGIMDAWSDADTEEVIVSGSAQTGKSLVLHAALAYSIDLRLGPRMLAMQDDDALAKVVGNKLLPMLKACPATKGKFLKIRSGQFTFRDSTALFFASAQSASQRASISIQDLFLDEEALYKQISGQGVPTLEFLERTRSYARTRKILRVSKPIGGEDCTICRALHEDCDELRHYEACCPACGAMVQMLESGLVLSEKNDNPKEVHRRHLGRYKCQHCGYLWTDFLRDRAVSKGRWVSENSVPHPRRVGFYLPAILSSGVSLSEIIAEKMRSDCTDDPAIKQQYVNGYWAQPYRAVQIETQADTILAHRDDGLPARTVPSDAVALTAGIDTQKRGFWFTVWAWSPNLQPTLIDYGRLKDWDDVAALMFQTQYPFEDGPKMGQSIPIWRAGIDSGGGRATDAIVSRTEEVYSFVRRNGLNRLFACKGLSQSRTRPVSPTSIDRMPTTHAQIPGGLWLMLLDTIYFKSLIFSRLEVDAKFPIVLHRETEISFADQIASESLVRGKNGNMVWVQNLSDNHYLDCTVMATACVDGTWEPSFERLLSREPSTQYIQQNAKKIFNQKNLPSSGRTIPSRSIAQRQIPLRRVPLRG